jgi:Mrp family chromosome partitioning ATPase
VAQLFTEGAQSQTGSGRSSTNTTVDPQAALEETFAPAPTRVGPITRAGIGGAVGLLLGAAIALIIERIDPRIRTKQEAEDAFGWPVITETPPISRKQRKQMVVLSHEAPRSRFAEAYRSLRSAVLFACSVADGTVVTDSRELPSGGRARSRRASAADEYHAQADQPARVLMVTSPSPSEGKTTTTSNLASVLAEAGFEVLVINCDFRRPRVHAYLGAEGDYHDVVSTAVPRVSLLSKVLESPELANPAEVVAAQRDAIDRNRTTFDFILLDTAPLLSTNDAAEVLDESDFVIVVGRTGQTTKEAADRAAELLERRNAPVVGIVLVGATDRPSSRYYYYGDGGAYYEDRAVMGGGTGSSALERLSTQESNGPASDSVEREPVRDANEMSAQDGQYEPIDTKVPNSATSE